MSPEDPIPTIYSDAVKVSVSPSTFTLIFSRQETWVHPQEERELIRVQMSPTHFKLMVSVLPQLLTQYEENVGEIMVKGLDVQMLMDSQQSDESEVPS